MTASSSIADLWTKETSTWLHSKGNTAPADFMAYMSGRDPKVLLEWVEERPEGAIPQVFIDTLRAVVAE